jgi:hypothetical protein
VLAIFVAFLALRPGPGALHPPELVEAGGVPVVPGLGHADAALYDWDGDGVRDLFVGQFEEGKILYFRNEGTEREKRFAAGVYLEAGGQPIKIDVG